MPWRPSWSSHFGTSSGKRERINRQRLRTVSTATSSALAVATKASEITLVSLLFATSGNAGSSAWIFSSVAAKLSNQPFGVLPRAI